MRVIHCEQCDTSLPWTAQYCAVCGSAVSLHPLISDYLDAPGDSTKRPGTDSLNTYPFYTMEPGDPDETLPFGSPHLDTVPDDPDETLRLDHSHVQARNTPVPAAQSIDEVTALAFLENWPEDEEMDEEMLRWRRDTWQKFVTRKTPAIAIGASSAVATPPPAVPATPVTPSSPYRVRMKLTPI